MKLVRDIMWLDVLDELRQIILLEFQVFYKFNEFILCARHTQQLVDGMRVPAPESKEDQNQGSSKQLNQST